MSRPAQLALVPLLATVLIAACSRPEPVPEPVRSVRTVTVSRTSAGGAHEYAAEIRARTEVRLAFRVAGKMTSRPAEVGRHVQAGEVLARLDPEDLRLSQEAARAAVNAAQVNHDLALADFKRFKDLRDQGFISTAELDRREAALKSAAAQLSQAQAQASVQGNQATYASLVAAAPGVVVGVDAEPGAVLAAGTPVVRLALDGPRDVVFSVPEDAVSTLRPLAGQVGGVRVKLWGSEGTLRATVREVAAAADPATRTFQVKADVAAGALHLGQTATVFVDLPRVDGVTLLPLTAVKEHKGQSAVWVVDRQRQAVVTRVIQVGGAQGNEVVVARGLEPGEVVVTAGVHVLTEGQKVRLAATGGAPAGSAGTPVAAAGASQASR